MGIEIEPTFAAVFDQSIAQEALQHFWNSIRRQLPHTPGAGEMRPEDLFQALAAASDQKAKPAKLLQQLGGAMLVGSIGFRGTAALLGRHCTQRSWQRHKRDLKALPQLGPFAFAALDQVDAALNAFSTLRLADFRTSSVHASVGRMWGKHSG